MVFSKGFMVQKLNIYLSMVVLYMFVSIESMGLVKQLDWSTHIDKKIVLIGELITQ
jgi:hypothetical protein